jgi:hypothetical protein
MLLENPASCDTLKDCLGGMWSYGSGPEAARVVRFKAVMTSGFSSVYWNQNIEKTPNRSTTQLHG